MIARTWVATSDFSILGSKSAGVGGAKFYENSDTPDPYSFNGTFAPATMSFAFGRWTPAAGVAMGRNLGDLTGAGYSTDLFAIEMGKGEASIIGTPIEESCCE